MNTERCSNNSCIFTFFHLLLQVTYDVLTTAEIPEEEDANYDSDYDPPFIPPAIPDQDYEYDEYSDGEIAEGKLINNVY